MADRNLVTPFEQSHFKNTPDSRSALQDTGARAGHVNRAHRVVRERAKSIAERRSKIRSLWLPVAIFSSVLVAICIAVWMVLDEYEIVSAGGQAASYQVLVPLLWSIPVSAALLAVVWFRQSRSDPSRRGSYYN